MSNRATGLVPGLAALLLFGVMALAILNAEFGEPAGFALSGEAADSVVHNIGYALFNLDLGSLAPATEGFLAAFLIIAVTLDVAVDGALYLAKREDEGGTVVSAVGEAFTDGGRPVETGDGRPVETGDGRPVETGDGRPVEPDGSDDGGDR